MRILHCELCNAGFEVPDLETEFDCFDCGKTYSVLMPDNIFDLFSKRRVIEKATTSDVDAGMRAAAERKRKQDEDRKRMNIATKQSYRLNKKDA